MKHGTVYPIKDGQGNLKYMQQFPQVSISNKCLHNIRAICAEFGMTPSSRASMTTPNSDEDEFDDILGK